MRIHRPRKIHATTVSSRPSIRSSGRAFSSPTAPLRQPLAQLLNERAHAHVALGVAPLWQPHAVTLLLGVHLQYHDAQEPLGVLGVDGDHQCPLIAWMIFTTSLL